MRGIYGEGSEALGDLYQVSNQITLGRREEDIIDAVTAVGKQLIDMESKLRERCRTQQKAKVEDTLWRGTRHVAEFLPALTVCSDKSCPPRRTPLRKAIRAAEPARTPRGAGALSAAAGEAETV